MMLDGEITAADYRDIKARYEPEIRSLQQDKADSGQITKRLNENIAGAMRLLQNLHQYYVSASLSGKQKLIGSMFAEKIVFEKTNYRTIDLHPTVEILCRTGAGSSGKKMG